MFANVTRKSKPFFLTYGKLIFTLIAVACLVIYAIKKSDHTEKHGIITVAKVLRYEAAESGGSLVLDVYLRNKVIEISAGTSCYFCVGGYYFVKVLEDDPGSFPVL